MNKILNMFKRKKLSLRDKAVMSLYEAVRDYSAWYDEKGLYLPPDYATTPHLWSEEMHKMTNAFELLYDELHGEGELWEAKNSWEDATKIDKEKIDRLTKEIQEGFEAFGKQLLHMTDAEK